MKQAPAGFNDVYDGNKYKYNYLQMHVADGTIGDYGKNFHAYPSKGHTVTWQRRLGANFNYGAIAAALGYSLNTTLIMGHVKAREHTSHLHPQSEQDAIEDGYWYYYATHPEAAKRDGAVAPKGFKFGR